jgi:uncharacterized membrane protein YdjX (TVP38/TMEM64 family)
MDKITLLQLCKALILLLLLVAAGVIIWQQMPPELFNPAWIEAFLKQAGWLAPLIYIFLRVIAIVVTVVPNAPLDIAGGMLFGPFWGTVFALLGSEAGAIACFLLARQMGREAITRLLHRDITFSNSIARRQLAYIVLLARLEPVFSFAFVSYGAGLTRMTLGSFALSTLIGMTPGTIILNYYGKSFFSGSLMLQICLGLALVVLLFVIPVWIKRKNPWGWYDKLTGGDNF